MIGADVFQAATGARRGHEDRRRRRRHRPHEPVLQRRRLHVSGRLPARRQTKWTTPKVIVARAFPGPGSGEPGSWRSTAGVVPRHARRRHRRGRRGHDRARRRDHPPTRALRRRAARVARQLPRLQPCRRRSATSRTRRRSSTAFEEAVADGMDVINFSGGGPQTDPVNDVLVEAIEQRRRGRRRARHLGRQRPRRLRLRHGRLAGHRAGRDLRRRRLEHPGLRPGARAYDVGRHGDRSHVADPVAAATRPTAWANANQTLVDVGTITGRNGQPVDRQLCGTGDRPERLARHAAGRAR